MSESRFFRPGHPPAKSIVTVAIAISIASLVAGWVGDAIWVELVEPHPLLLMALTPRNRYLALVSNEVSTLSYYLVGFLRLVASDPVNYLLGLWFGDKAIAWVGRKSKTYGPLIDDGAAFFRRYSAPLIFLMPNNIICALAGASGVKVRTFMVANITGTVARLVLVRQFSSYFESEIGGITEWIGRYRTPLLIVSVLAVAWTVFGEFRGDNSELKNLVHLEDELDGDETGATDGPSTDGPSADQ
ncbi:MAG: hypothetical protein R2733_15245 [Acidimicrobiales bacterium]